MSVPALSFRKTSLAAALPRAAVRLDERFPRSWIATAVLAFAALPSGPAVAVPLFQDFHVNSTTSFHQSLPAVAMDADGDFVVAWAGPPPPFVGSEVFLQRHAADGTRLGPELRVNSYTSNLQTQPVVAMDADGDFVVAWSSRGQRANDIGSYPSPDRYGVYAQRYAADGTPRGGEFAVDSGLTGNQVVAGLAMDALGNFIVAWGSNERAGSYGDVYARRYDAGGRPLAAQFRVNTSTTGQHSNASIAAAADGRFVIAWDNATNNLPQGSIVYVRPYAADGQALGAELRANSQIGSRRGEPAVAMDADGDFAVTWRTYANYLRGIFGRRYTAAGAAEPEFFVDSVNAQSPAPVAAMDAEGELLIAWTDTRGHPSDTGIRARRYRSNGAAAGPAFAVSEVSSNVQQHAGVALDADGDTVLAWENYSADGRGREIFAQRLPGTEGVDLDLGQLESADPVPVSSSVQYRLTVGNRSLGALQPTGIAAIDQAVGIARGLRLIGFPPAGQQLLNLGGTDWTCQQAGPRIVCDYLHSLPAGAEAPPIIVGVSTPDTPGVLLSNVARIAGQEFDPQPDNNRSVERSRVSCAASTVQWSTTLYNASEADRSVLVGAVRSGGSCGAVSVQFDSAGISATPGHDFTDVSGVLNWADGETGTRSFAIPIADDALHEAGERFSVTLSALRGGAVLGSLRRARVSIASDDPAPRVNFTAVAQSAPESPALVQVTVVLGAVSGRDAMVPLSYGGSAALGDDYLRNDTQLLIPAGQLRSSTTLEIADDALAEDDETVVITMGTPVGALRGSLNTHTLSILDDDDAP